MNRWIYICVVVVSYCSIVFSSSTASARCNYTNCVLVSASLSFTFPIASVQDNVHCRPSILCFRLSPIFSYRWQGIADVTCCSPRAWHSHLLIWLEQIVVNKPRASKYNTSRYQTRLVALPWRFDLFRVKDKLSQQLFKLWRSFLFQQTRQRSWHLEPCKISILQWFGGRFLRYY